MLDEDDIFVEFDEFLAWYSSSSGGSTTTSSSGGRSANAAQVVPSLTSDATSTQRPVLEAHEVRRLFDQVDRDSHEVLDSEQVMELIALLSMDLGGKTRDTVITEVLNPDGSKMLDEDDIFVEFDEFLAWYTSSSSGGSTTSSSGGR